MKIISSNNEYTIYNNTLCTYDTLPAQSYNVRFTKQKGFFLEKHSDIEISENKIYGVHTEKVEKVLRSFSVFDRNLGVILSGDKGIGKSLFAKILSIKAIESGLPVIIVDEYIPGIASYIDKIEQEVLVIFDEFDKTFCDVTAPDGEINAQTALLSMFDGISGGKKLFVITCNHFHKLNEYLINRPGRFHYHFRFNYPSADEITEYLHDKLSSEHYAEIPSVVSFAKKVDLNYDCLRAIAFEINSGLSFKYAIEDLNILNIDNKHNYDIVLTFNNGVTLKTENVSIDLFDSFEKCVWFGHDNGSAVGVRYKSDFIKYNAKTDIYYIDAEDLKVETDTDYDEDEVAKTEEVIKSGVESFILRRSKNKDFRYAV